jgi:2,3-diaminopropionate biosynthesis protein SbnB
MKPAELLFLSQEDTIAAGVLDMSLVVPTMEEVFRLHHQGDYVLPSKSVLRWGDKESESIRGRINSMPGWIGGDIQAVGIKWIASSPMNPFKHDLPRASAVIVLNDPGTLLPIAVMDGTAISAARTGANTGVAARYLAKPGSRALGLIGAGVQNRTQLLALKYAMPSLEDIRVYDIDLNRAQAFAQEMSLRIGSEIRVVASAYEAVCGADIFVSATVTQEPIVKADWIEPGVFYSHVGSHECEFEVINRMDKLVVDDWEEIKHRGVETLAILYSSGTIRDDSIYAELGEIVDGYKRGRERDDETIYLNTVRMGIEDVALANRVYERAMSLGLGQKLRLWSRPFAV